MIIGYYRRHCLFLLRHCFLEKLPWDLPPKCWNRDIFVLQASFHTSTVNSATHSKWVIWQLHQLSDILLTALTSAVFSSMFIYPIRLNIFPLYISRAQYYIHYLFIHPLDRDYFASQNIWKSKPIHIGIEKNIRV